MFKSILFHGVYSDGAVAGAELSGGLRDEEHLHLARMLEPEPEAVREWVLALLDDLEDLWTQPPADVRGAITVVVEQIHRLPSASTRAELYLASARTAAWLGDRRAADDTARWAIEHAVTLTSRIGAARELARRWLEQGRPAGAYGVLAEVAHTVDPGPSRSSADRQALAWLHLDLAGLSAPRGYEAWVVAHAAHAAAWADLGVDPATRHAACVARAHAATLRAERDVARDFASRAEVVRNRWPDRVLPEVVAEEIRVAASIERVEQAQRAIDTCRLDVVADPGGPGGVTLALVGFDELVDVHRAFDAALALCHADARRHQAALARAASAVDFVERAAALLGVAERCDRLGARSPQHAVAAAHTAATIRAEVERVARPALASAVARLGPGLDARPSVRERTARAPTGDQVEAVARVVELCDGADVAAPWWLMAGTRHTEHGQRTTTPGRQRSASFDRARACFGRAADCYATSRSTQALAEMARQAQQRSLTGRLPDGLGR